MKIRSKSIGILFPLILTALLIFQGCVKPPAGNGTSSNGDAQLGRYIFEGPTAFGEVGTIDIPRMEQYPGGDIQLVYLYAQGTSQHIKYTRMENGAFREPVLLSNREGNKRGGGFIHASGRNDLTAYWVNIGTTGGRLYYRSSGDSGRTFSLEEKLNQRPEARWPCMVDVGTNVFTYFFVNESDSWNLVVNRNYSAVDEPTVESVYGTPHHLTGLSDGVSKIWLAFFERRENSNGGRIVLYRSDDSGQTFFREYLFDDMVIPNVTSFFRIARSSGSKNIVHLIYTEETPDLTTIYYSRSEDDGVHFTIPVSLIQSEIALTSAPLLLVNGDYVFIATADAEEEAPALRYVFSEDGGRSFNPPAVATNSVANPESMTGVMEPDGKVIIVWDDLAATNEPGEQLYLLEGTLRGQ